MSDSERWDGLIERHGEVMALLGAASDDYFGSGVGSWQTIRPLLEPITGDSHILEWGAGSGRMTRAALADMPQGAIYSAYEPSNAARELLRQNTKTPCRIVDRDELVEIPLSILTHLYCIFACHHMDYDDLWQLFGFAESRLASGGVFVFDYIRIDTDTGRSFLARKDASEWPSRIWHPEQIRSLIEIRAPSLRHEQTIDLPRELQSWRHI